MAGTLRADSIDFAHYMRLTEPAAKVRQASEFAAEVVNEFAERDSRAPALPTMTSTKLAGRLEFRPGEVTLWAGFNGHRKSMFSGQVALDLLVDGQRTLIASLEMQPARTLARMCRQASGKRFPSSTWVEGFARWTDDRLWLYDQMGRVSPEMAIAVCRYFAQELKGQQVFIDSLMMVCASEEHLDEQKQFATDLVRTAQETGLHIHLIAHARKPASGDESRPPTKYEIRGSAALSDQAANVVTVWANKGKAEALERDPHDSKVLNDPDAMVSVEKQRNGEFEGKLKLWFDSASMRFMNDRTSRVEPYPLCLPQGQAATAANASRH